MPGLINYGTGQYGAVAGGRRRRSPYRDIIYAAQPQIYAKKAREEDVSYRQRRLASERVYQEKVLAQSAEDLASREKAEAERVRLTEADAALRRRQLEEAKKQAKTSNILSGAQTGVLGGYLGYKTGLFGKLGGLFGGAGGAGTTTGGGASQYLPLTAGSGSGAGGAGAGAGASPAGYAFGAYVMHKLWEAEKKRGAKYPGQPLVKAIGKERFSLPKVSLPKVSLPKVSLPKVSLPKFSLW